MLYSGCVCEENHFYDTQQNRREPIECKKESECSCFHEPSKLHHKPGSVIKHGECSTW
jgi:hypothetical protein